jgi:ribosome maturation factor RimP
LTSQSPEKKRLPTETNEIARIIEPSLEAMGYRLVRIAFVGARAATLQIMAERADEAAMTVEDCAEISRTVSALLDVADPIAGAYTLEISSPGIDRPLVRPEDYERFAGFEAKVELAQPLDGRKRFRGRLLGRTDRGARLLAETGEVLLPFDTIQRAKLVISNELMAAPQHNFAKPGPAGPDSSSQTH